MGAKLAQRNELGELGLPSVLDSQAVVAELRAFALGILNVKRASASRIEQAQIDAQIWQLCEKQTVIDRLDTLDTITGGLSNDERRYLQIIWRIDEERHLLAESNPRSPELVEEGATVPQQSRDVDVLRRRELRHDLDSREPGAPVYFSMDYLQEKGF